MLREVHCLKGRLAKMKFNVKIILTDRIAVYVLLLLLLVVSLCKRCCCYGIGIAEWCCMNALTRNMVVVATVYRQVNGAVLLVAFEEEATLIAQVGHIVCARKFEFSPEGACRCVAVVALLFVACGIVVIFVVIALSLLGRRKQEILSSCPWWPAVCVKIEKVPCTIDTLLLLQSPKQYGRKLIGNQCLFGEEEEELVWSSASRRQWEECACYETK